MSRKELVLGAIENQIINYQRILRKSLQKLDYNEKQNVVRRTPCSLCDILKIETDVICQLCPWNLFAPEGKQEEFRCEEVLKETSGFTSYWDVKGQIMHSCDKREITEAREVIERRIKELEEWKVLAKAKDEDFFAPKDALESLY